MVAACIPVFLSVGCEVVDEPEGKEKVEAATQAITACGTPSVSSVNTANGIFNVTEYGACPNDGVLDDVGVQLALQAALTSGGTLLFPPGEWELSESLMLTCDPSGPGGDCTHPLSKAIQIRGANASTTRIKSSASDALSIEQGYLPGSILLEDFWLSGNGVFTAGNEQQGVSFCDNALTPGLTIERMKISNFNGNGICVRGAYNARITQNKITAVQTGIRCQDCRISVIESNRVSTFFDKGIAVEADPTAASSAGSIAVRVVANEVMNLTGSSCSETAAIHVGRGNSVQVETNYIEGVEAPSGCGATTSGILVKPNGGKSRNTFIKANYTSGNNGELAIQIDQNAYHSVVELTGGADKIIDNGLMTTFLYQYIGAGDPDLAGSSSTRRGWLGRGGWYTPPSGPAVPNPVFRLHEYSEY